jgi:Protein of unknown function (DUF3228)
MSAPTIGWSDFALGRYKPGTSHAYYTGSNEALLDLVQRYWDDRYPGAGREDLSKVVIVPLPPEGFVCGTVQVDETSELSAELVRRQPHEEPYLQVKARGPREAATFAGVVLYSADTLLENDGKRSGDCAWEIVCVLASPVRDEPIDPLTMARNMLEKPGGTYCDYTAQQFAESIWYWSRRAGVEVD